MDLDRAGGQADLVGVSEEAVDFPPKVDQPLAGAGKDGEVLAGHQAVEGDLVEEAEEGIEADVVVVDTIDKLTCVCFAPKSGFES